ncbi:uncharacterized protein LOC144433353 [Glandiceps talaboti]
MKILRYVLWLTLLSRSISQQEEEHHDRETYRHPTNNTGLESLDPEEQQDNKSCFRQDRLDKTSHHRVPRFDMCFEGTFKCINSTQCILRELLCDNHEDCDNGSDESDEECIDRKGHENTDTKIGEKDDSSEEEAEELGGEVIPCDLGSYPKQCNCTHIVVYDFRRNDSNEYVYETEALQHNIIGTHLDCSYRNLITIPDDIPDNVTRLDLRFNRIQEIGSEDLAGLLGLRELILTKNNLTELNSSSLKDQINLEKLVIAGNKLTSLPEDIFSKMKNMRNLNLAQNKIRHLPSNVFASLGKLEELDLSGNKLRLLDRKLFENQSALKTLKLNWNRPLEIEYGVFDELENLQTLGLLDTGLSHIRSGIFRSLGKVTKLDLERNRLLSIKKYDLEGLDNLAYLQLKNNTIQRIEAGAFDHIPKVKTLRLSLNNILEIRTDVFSSLHELQILDLSFNKIAEFENEALINSQKLTHLLLPYNNLPDIRVGIFAGLSAVTNLELFNNDISMLEVGSFDDMMALYTLDLRENPFSSLPREIFVKLESLDWVYFDHFSMCGYAPTIRHCSPRGNGISSIENLLDNMVLRIMVWIVALLAFVGNIFVLIARCLLKEDNRVHAFFIMNLSFADLLMGIYLFIIAIHDVIYRGEYIKFDLTWRLSWVCQMCGFLSLVSSEASVLTLTIITLDRFICIVYPFKFKNRNLKLAFWVMLMIWLLCTFLAILPLIEVITYFGAFFYGGNGVCLPLHIDEPKANGWEYSLFIFVLVNFVAFVFISFAYVAMFSSIRKSRTNIRSTKENQDLILVKRFTLIVATDFICWMPIIIVKFAAFAGAKISGDVYAWIAIFILPVNSALNPILYTLTTKMFKQKMLRALGVTTKKEDDSYTTSKSTGTRLSSTCSRSRISISGKHGNGSVNVNARTTSLRTTTREPKYLTKDCNYVELTTLAQYSPPPE